MDDRGGSAPATASGRLLGGVVGVTIIGAVAPLLPAALDEAMIVKAAAVLVGVTAVVAWTLAVASSGGRFPVPAGVATWVLVGFAVVVLAATTWSDAPVLSLVGPFERYSGGLMYAAYALLGLCVLAWLPTGSQGGAVPWLLGGAVTVVGYGLVQLVGLDPVTWSGRFGDAVIAQFGNPDFVSGYLGIMAPLALWGAVWSPWRSELRILAGVGGVAGVVVLVGAGALQGYVAGAVGIGVLVLAVVAARWGRGRLVWSGAAVAGGGVGVVLAAGAAGIGPATGLWEISTARSRTYLWRTATEMIGAEPFTGVGLGRYGRYYHEFRPVDEAVRRDLDQAADAAHNVLLDLAAGGGGLVALAWLAVVAVAVVSLVRAWRAGDQDRRVLIGALGGAYAAYHVQAAVSLDVPPLAATHLVLVGAIVSASPGMHLRWLRPRAGSEFGPLRRRLVAAAMAIPVIVVVGMVLVADNLAGSGAEAGERGDFDAAGSRTEDATGLAPWQPEYHFEHARALARAGRLDAAVDAMDRVLERDPRDLAAWISRGRLLTALDRPLEAVEAYAGAREIAPKSPELGVEYAEALIAVGQRTLAREVLLGVVAIAPEHAPALDLLEDL
ncbi:MAG: tetratricopeptide repeat protein [Nitriliruptorales bacterium]|nr:tetratricopeptide repeat protein [Nitriliruptorales bacterium]